MHRPDYRGGSIVNLMASLVTAVGGESSAYAPLRRLPPAAVATRNVVLLVIDGLGYRFLDNQGARSVLRSHVHDRLTTVFPSTTAAAVTTFFTGLAPQQHGVTGWHTYFKELDRILAVLPFRARDNGPTLAETGVEAATLFHHAPVFDRVPIPSYVVAPERIVDSAFNVAHTGSAQRLAYASLSQCLSLVADCVRAPGPAYVYAYYPELDRLAHEHGIGSAQVALHFGEIDTAFAQFLGDIASTDTTVIVTGDHGFVDIAPDDVMVVNDEPELARTLARPLAGEQRTAYCYVKPDKRERFVRYFLAHLSDRAVLFESERLIEEGIFGLGSPHPRLQERVGDYTLIMKDRYAIKDWLPGERHFTMLGMHGGLSEDEMLVPLIVAKA